METELNPLDLRIMELMEITAQTHAGVPEWYRKLCVETYIREEEPELLIWKPTEIKKDLPTDKDNIVIINPSSNIETVKDNDETN